MSGLLLTFVLGLVVAAAVVATQDPDSAWAVALFILCVGVSAGSLTILLQLRAADRAPRRGRRISRALAVRRGVETGAIVALLVWLRVVDGLSILTAFFVIGAFVVAELVLSARPESGR